ncbi:MAG: tetratricopeptide repeat protein [Thermoanaerobaculales bacterium]
MSKCSVVRAVPVLAILVLAGNAGADSEPRFFGYSAWQQAVIERQLDPQEVVFPFEATPQMMAWAKEKLQTYTPKEDILQLTVLQNALFDASYSFAYDNLKTLTAADAFAAREGNCMSFTALFVAISRGLGFPTFLVSVRRAPSVEKTESVVVVNHHVVAAFRSPSKVYIFDFYATSTEPYSFKRVIDDITASAIFHTNLGGEGIRDGDLDEARRHLEIATTLAPDWAPAWVNLGVTRFRSGDVEGALEAYRSALLADPSNPSALTNMSITYRSLGREEEADTALRAAAEDTKSPFTLIAMADVDMVQGDLESARRYLRRARWWYGKEPEVHDALARLAMREGDAAKAEKHARQAAALRRKRSEAIEGR